MNFTSFFLTNTKLTTQVEKQLWHPKDSLTLLALGAQENDVFYMVFV